MLLTRFMACEGEGGRIRRAHMKGTDCGGRVFSPPSTQRPPGCQLPRSPGKLRGGCGPSPCPTAPRGGRPAHRECPGQGRMTEDRCPLGLAHPLELYYGCGELRWEAHPAGQ